MSEVKVRMSEVSGKGVRGLRIRRVPHPTADPALHLTLIASGTHQPQF